MLQKCSISNVAGVFFDEPTKPHYLIEISKKSGIAHTSVKRCLNSLKKEGIISERTDKKGKRNFPVYSANFQDEKFKQYKKAHNFSRIIESGIIEYIRDKLMPKAIVLFGSYLRGEDIEGSDIDIFAEAKPKDLDVSKYEKLLKRKIEIHFNEKFNNYPKELKNNIINGNIMYGYLEVFE